VNQVGEAKKKSSKAALPIESDFAVDQELPPPELDNVPTFPRIELRDLFRLAERPDDLVWQSFQDGVDIHRLYGDGRTGPSAALLRFRKAGKVSLHEHGGYEHILVLAGAQRDQNGNATAGTLMINPPGTRHSVTSEAGCIVLAIYQDAVQFAPDVVETARAAQ
jgi:quercetin dioxygenase-like cupin family protein